MEKGELQRGLGLCHPLLPTKAMGGLGMGREITEGHSRRGAGSQSRGGGSRRLRPGDESAGSWGGDTQERRRGSQHSQVQRGRGGGKAGKRGQVQREQRRRRKRERGQRGRHERGSEAGER